MQNRPNFKELVDIAQEVFNESSFSSPTPVTIPSPSFVTAGGKIVGYERKKLLRTAFPVPEAYSNPAGYLQGGYLTTMIDDTFGPLSYLAAGKPAVTLNLSTTFLRPVPIGEAYIMVEAEVVSRGRRVVTMNARAENSSGRLVATATSINQIMEGSR